MEKVLRATYRTKNVFADGYVIITDISFLGTFADDSLLISPGKDRVSLFLTGYNYDSNEFSMHRYTLPGTADFKESHSYKFSDGVEVLTLNLLEEIDDQERIDYVKTRIAATK